MEIKKLQVFLADDHLMVAEGIRKLLLEIGFVKEVILFKNGKEICNQLKESTPDFVFLDIQMPILNGFETIKEIRASFPDLPIVMLTMLDEPSVVKNCLREGANGFLLKDSTLNELQNCIERVKNGELYLSKSAQQLLFTTEKRNAVSNTSIPNFTKRESEILQLLCEGFTTKEIADKIHVSPRTVETHKENIMEKCNIHNGTKLIATAIKNKWISI